MNTVLFSEDVTLLDFIIRAVCLLPFCIFMIGFLINELIIRPIKKFVNLVKKHRGY